MKKSSLRTIQKLAKVGRILSILFLALSVLVFVSCFVGIICLACSIGILQYADVAAFFTKVGAFYNVETAFATCVIGMVTSLGRAVLAGFAIHYFKRELNDGTPFCREGVKELKRLGILTLCIPLGAELLAYAAYGMLTILWPSVTSISVEITGQIPLGAAFLVAALLCQYGVEQQEQRAQQTEPGGPLQ